MLTVLMATHNGAQTLPRVLESYCKLDAPPGGWTFVIVNNGSTDQTADIIASFATRLPLTCIWEPKPGKSAALNRALSTVDADLIVLTDDDVVPNHDWLVQFRQTADLHPSFSIFGGLIVPLWETTPENWILPFSCVLGATDPSWEEGPIAATRISSANIALRREIIDAGYRFDPSLGPIGSHYQMGEETDFLQRIEKAGFIAWHCKAAVGGHIIRKKQVNKRWMLSRARAFGRAMYRMDHFQSNECPKPPALLLGAPRYLVREILVQSLRVAKARLIRNSTDPFQEDWKLHYLIGRALGGRVVHQEQLKHSTATTRSAAPDIVRRRTADAQPDTADRQVAVTFDDLPATASNFMSGAEIMEMTARLLASLQQQQIPAIGFVNEKKLYKWGEVDQRIRALQMWLDAGFELGNHTYSHASLNKVDLKAWEEEVIGGESVLRLLLAEHKMSLRYFRHPFLDTGLALETRRAAEVFLAGRGYRIAPVTLDASDWMFSSVYDDAWMSGDFALQRQISASYLTHADRMFDHCEKISKQLMGYEPKQVLVLHANLLGADHIADLAALMRKRGYRFITLENAVGDSAYGLPDTYVGPGTSWLYHWAETQGKWHEAPPSIPAWLLERAKAVSQLTASPNSGVPTSLTTITR